MTETEWKSPAAFAIQRLAQRCIEHPQLEADPVCVIATERERVLEEIERAEPVELPKPAVCVGHCNGRKKERVRA